MNRLTVCAILFCIGLFLAARAPAQDAPATAPTAAPVAAPASAPATSPTTRPAKVETPPPGFQRVTAGRFSAFCQKVDEQWVKQALGQAHADKLPTTRPADIIAKIAQQRDAIAKDLNDQTGIDPTKTQAMLDDDLLPTLKKIDALQPPVVFLVATESTVISLLDNGWENPRVNYNRLMKKLNYDDHITVFSIDRTMDETMQFCIYDPADSPAERTKKLTAVVQQFESDVAFAEAGQAKVVTRGKFGQLIEDQVFTPLKLGEDQSWLHFGVTTWLTARYSTRVTGGETTQTLADLIYEPPNAFIKADTLDLLALPDLKAIRPEFRSSYVYAGRRKATLVVQALVQRGGEDAIRKVLAAVKKNPPQDGAALVSLIKTETGVDLSAELHAGK